MKKSTVALIVSAVILGGAFIAATVFGVLKIIDKRSGDDLPIVTAYESFTLEQEETTGERHTENEKFTEYSVTEPEETVPETQENDGEGGYLENLSAEEIELLNLFLSNFSELYYENIDNGNAEDMINFVVVNTKVNYKENILVDTSDGHYTEYISEEYMAKRIDRYFGVSIEPVSTEICTYENGRYYPEMSEGERFLNNFTKVISATQNPDGTVTVNYDVYGCDIEFGLPPERYYKGVGSANLDSGCTYRYSGTAVLEPVYLGEGYANYHLISMEKN